MTTDSNAPASGGRGDASRAIAAKRKQAQENRDRIATALLRMQQAGVAINVQAVARAANVSADTVRRNEDLYREVRRLRDQVQTDRPGARESHSSAALRQARGQVADAREEIKELRRDLAIARAAAHQTLGGGIALLTPEEAEELRTEHAELTVALQDARQEVKRLKDERDDLVDELTAAHDLNREFTRRLTVAEGEAQRARAEAGLARRSAGPNQ